MVNYSVIYIVDAVCCLVLLLFTDCNKLLSSSLILVGEIGGNDYNNPLLAGKSIEQVQTYVPLVIEEISSTIKVRI